MQEIIRTVYFCHPRSPWVKGMYENTDYLICDILYTVDDFRELTQRECQDLYGF